jgi:hypothetical protein
VVDFRALHCRKDEEVAYNTIYINRKALTGHFCMDFGVTARNSLTWTAIRDWAWGINKRSGKGGGSGRTEIFMYAARNTYHYASK